MKKETKTNAMRILDQKKVHYTTHQYAIGDEHLSGNEIAQQLNQDPNIMFKTIVCISKSKQYYVFCIPVNHELDLKKCAKAVHEKNIELLPLKDLTKITGYIRGGCSPIGMKKSFPTIIDEHCLKLDSMIVSAGKKGYQIECTPQDLIAITNAKTFDISK